MQALGSKDREDIRRAFELAYFILPDRGVALRVAEEVCCTLGLMLGKQEKHRKSYTQLFGYVKWDERSRPLRTKIRLSHEQMLQWLVYYQSDSWERATEYGGSLYPPNAEDMVVRYVKHLVRTTLNRNSFYITLGITRLLYHYGTREVRLMYDVITSSDSARMKDAKYLRKQKAKLMEEILTRFDGMLQEVTTGYREKQFDSQPTTGRLIRLVHECLRRFTPWETVCVIQENFDPIEITELYFSGADPTGEDRIEVNRAHTVIHPDCFSRLVDGLAQFVRSLPPDSPDKDCDYGAPDKRLAVPRFHNVTDGDPRDGRFSPPRLTPEDYLRLERNREALRQRREGHQSRLLRVYVDGVERASFDPRRTPRAQLDIEPEAGLVEVRADDDSAELLLAGLIICADDFTSGELFQDRIVLEGGQQITVRVKPVRDPNGDLEAAQVEVSYAETGPVRSVIWHAQRAYSTLAEAFAPRGQTSAAGLNHVWLWQAGMGVALLLSALAIIWLSLPRPDTTPPPSQAETPILPPVEPPQTPPAPPPAPPAPEQKDPLIARVQWRRDPEAGGQAIRLEPTRGEVGRVEVSRRQKSLLIALPRTGPEGRRYTHYRLILSAGGKPIWRQTLRAPGLDPTGQAHVLSISLANQPRMESFLLEFEGKNQEGWHPLGRLNVQFVE